MTKKNIQVILSILVLTLLSLGGLYYFSQQSRKGPDPTTQQPPQPTKPVEAPSVLSTVSFQDDEASQKIILSQVRKKNYRVRLFDQENGFSILFPNTEMTLNANYPDPIPWVDSILFEEKPFRGNPSVEMTVSTVDGIALFDQLQSGTLTIELQNTKASIIEDTKPTPKPKKAPPKPKPAPEPTPEPDPVATPEPEPAPEPDPSFEPEFEEETNTFAQQEEIEEELPVFEDESTSQEVPFDDTDATFDDDTTFEPEFSNEDVSGSAEFDQQQQLEEVDEEELSIMDMETSFSLGQSDQESDSDDVAAVPPSDDGTFDMGVGSQLSLVSEMQVQTLPNGRTSVRFVRQDSVPYKIFKLRNPYRLVIDFKDATSSFDPSGAAGMSTAIERVETQQFESSESKLLRVIMYLKDQAEYVSRKEGNDLILEIP